MAALKYRPKKMGMSVMIGALLDVERFYKGKKINIVVKPVTSSIHSESKINLFLVCDHILNLVK